MTRQPTFSVCIPNYNYGHFIADTVASVLNQSYPHFEVIVADNASTDNSVDAVEAFRSDKVRLIRNRYNIGFSPNLDRATELAKNDFIILLSSDDVMQPEALQRYADIIQMHEKAWDKLVIFSSARVIDGGGSVTGVKTAMNQLIRPDLEPNIERKGAVERVDGLRVLRSTLSRTLSMPGPFCSMAYSKKLYEAVEGYRNTRLVDPDAHFVHKVLALDPTVFFVDEELFCYRVHSSNQNAQMSRHRAIKMALDKYQCTFEYPEESFLEKVGLTRQDLINTFIDRFCLRQATFELLLGSPQLARRTFAFGFATYPGEMVRRRGTYLFALLASTGPVAPWLAKRAQTLKRQIVGRAN